MVNVTKQEAVQIIKEVVKDLECKDQVVSVLGSTKTFQYGRIYTFPNTTLVQNIHVEENEIQLTHSNDKDIVGRIQFDEVHEFIESGILHEKETAAFRRKLEQFNLSNTLQIYNCTMIWGYDPNATREQRNAKMIRARPIRIFGGLVEVLTTMGYTMKKDKISGFHQFEIFTMEKCC